MRRDVNGLRYFSLLQANKLLDYLTKKNLLQVMAFSIRNNKTATDHRYIIFKYDYKM